MEKIDKIIGLIKSSNTIDHELALIAAKELQLTDSKFKYSLYWSKVNPKLIDRYISRTYSGLPYSPYKTFKWI